MSNAHPHRPLVLALALLVLPVPVLASSPAAADEAAPGYRTEDVRYPGDGLTLAGLLMLPPDASPEAPAPAAVVLQGAGTSDRSNVWSRWIAEVLVGEGLVVLLTDKRGSGASGGDWRTAGFDDLAADALAGVGYLVERPEVDPGRVGLVGLSQGGWVAPIAAARSDRVAFVVDVSGASVSFGEQVTHEMAATARAAGLPEEQVAEVVALNREAGRYLATGDWARYEAARRAALERPWREIAEGFPGSPDQPVWTFLRRVADFDPMPWWILVEAPVLVVYGAGDEHDNVPVAESVRRLEFGFRTAAKENHEIVVVPGGDHGMIDHERRRLMPELVDTLARWIRKTTARPSSPGMERPSFSSGM